MEPDHKDFDAAQDMLELFRSTCLAARDEGIRDTEFVTKVFFSAFLDVAIETYGPLHAARWLRNAASDIERRIQA